MSQSYSNLIPASGLMRWLNQQVIDRLGEVAGHALIHTSKAHGSDKEGRYLWMLAQMGDEQLTQEFHSRRRYYAGRSRYLHRTRELKDWQDRLAEADSVTHDPGYKRLILVRIEQCEAYITARRDAYEVDTYAEEGK